MANYSIEGSITIKRLRTGDSLMITLDTNGIPLYQAVDAETGAVTPDWTQSANQPVITPDVSSARGNTVTLTNHVWKYNGAALTFNGATTNGWTTDSTGLFAINAAGALKIIGNLASKTNAASDTLTYSCTATSGGSSSTLTKDVTIVIQNMGSSAYYLAILATSEQLSSGVTSTILTTKLYAGGVEITDYYIKWYKDLTVWTDKAGQKSITVTRDDVDGTQLFVAEVYKNSTDTNYLTRSGLRIIDTADAYQVVCSITSDNKEVDTGKNVTVGAKIIKMSDSSEYTPSVDTWQMDVMDRDSWISIKSSATNSIDVTTTETDRNGNQYDVDVIAQVTF
jgi:hypothetical protein